MKPVRKPLSPRRRETFYTSKNGLCNECGDTAKPYAIDHIIPLENGGEDNEANFQILCIPCHKIKTKIDMAKIAKVRSVRQKFEGHKRPKQSIQSAGFSKAIKVPKLTKSPLPPKALYKDTAQ